MSNYIKDQEVINALISNLAVLMAQNHSMNAVRKSKKEINNKFIKRLAEAQGYITSGRSINIRNVLDGMALVKKILEEDLDIKGNGYYDVTERDETSQSINCSFCGHEFSASTSKQKYCSSKCRTAAYRSRQSYNTHSHAD